MGGIRWEEGLERVCGGGGLVDDDEERRPRIKERQGEEER